MVGGGDRRAAVLAALAPPFRLSGGPDFILSQRAPGTVPVSGATLWLQNPTERPVSIRFVATVDGGKGRGTDVFSATLAPLEVGALAVPVSIRFSRPHAVKFLVVSESRGRDHSADPPRIRAATPRHVDREATAARSVAPSRLRGGSREQTRPASRAGRPRVGRASGRRPGRRPLPSSTRPTRAGSRRSRSGPSGVPSSCPSSWPRSRSRSLPRSEIPSRS